MLKAHFVFRFSCYTSKAMNTRRTLLRALLAHKAEGLTIDELGARLNISRNAVQQHVTALERDGLIETGDTRATGGRPSRMYVLSGAGYESFARGYALLAQQVLETATATLGEEGVEGLLSRMAEDLAAKLRPRLQGLEGEERLEAVAELMNELGYEATPGEGGISAVNCIYHKLARRNRAVCRYDVKLLSLLLGRSLEHTSCMADGANRCVFALAGA
jgi:predicted ArsR family transcriptional regulator